MVRVKIVQKGWAGYTGNLGTAVFKDGIGELSQLEANRIGATIGIVEIDEDGAEGDVVNIAHEMVRTKAMSAEVVAPLVNHADKDIIEPEVKSKDEDKPEVKKHTREELEAIADKKGIKGLREISQPLGVKSVQMVELIDKILEAENAA